MYKTITAEGYRANLGLPPTYGVTGFLVYGAPYTSKYYDLIRSRLSERQCDVSYGTLDRFLAPILPFRVHGATYWFATAYGGARLSEWLHLACLFGSNMNLLLGSCGGLNPEAETHDVIVPPWSYGDESTTRAYAPVGDKRHHANDGLRRTLADRIRDARHRLWEGPTLTHQAMLAETWEDVQRWSQDGFHGVEMEAATVFAVSNHFGVPAAAMLRIADNLIRRTTVFDASYQSARERRDEVTADLFDIALSTLLDIA